MATDFVTLSPAYNGDSVPLTAGMITRLKVGVNNNVVRAQANSAPGVQGVNGVVLSGSSAPTSSVFLAAIGRTAIQMESGLTLAVGDTVYVSPTTAGKGTNVLPVEVSAIGTVADVSSYARLGTVEVHVNISAVTPASVAGVSSVATTKPGDTATPSVGAVVIGGGGWARVVNLTALAALSATNFPIGNTFCWVDTVGAYYQLQTSALTTTTTTVISAAGVVGAQWLRMNWRNPVWQAQTSWTVNTATGNDENPGSSGSPVLTLSEVARRLAYAEVAGAVTITVVRNMATTDTAEFTCYLVATAASITIAGTPTVLYTGTVTSATTAGVAPTTGQNTLTDSAITGGSFTAAGALAQGVLFTRTSGTVCSWLAAKDNGSQTARISAPMTLNVAQTLAPGDTYNFAQLPLLTMPRFPNVALYGQTITLKNWLATSGLNKMIESFFFVGCWLVSPRLNGGMTLSNVCLQGGSVFGASSNFPETAFSAIGGLLLGTGTTTIALQGCPYAQLISVAVTMQSCQLAVTDGSYLDQDGPDLLSYDCTTYPILVDYNSTFLQKHSGAFGGSNNAELVNVGHGSRFIYTTNPYFLSGSSTDVTTPLAANGTAATNVAGLPVLINAQANGIFATS